MDLMCSVSDQLRKRKAQIHHQDMILMNGHEIKIGTERVSGIYFTVEGVPSYKQFSISALESVIVSDLFSYDSGYQKKNKKNFKKITQLLHWSVD